MQVTSGIQCNLLSPSYSTIYAPQGDAKSRFVLIQLLEGAAPWEVPAGASVIIRAAKPDGTFCFYDTNEAGESAYSISGSTVTIELVGQVLTAPGPVLMQIDFYNSGGAHLSTFSFCCQVSESVVSDDDIVSSNYFSVLTATLTEMLQIEQAVKAAYGAPLVAATAAAMTDHTRVYVYTGSESGYINGNWYYWNGSAWASGGVYNSTAVNVDAAPTEGSTNPVSSGGVYAADAALESELDDVKSALFTENTVVSADLTALSRSITPGNTWNTLGGSTAGYIEIPSNAEIIVITPKSGVTNAWAFLNSIGTPTTGEVPDFSTSYPGRISANTSTPRTYVVEPDMHFIYFLQTNTNSVDVFPASVYIYTSRIIDDTLSIPGKAADAKAAGDAISAVSAAIPAVESLVGTFDCNNIAADALSGHGITPANAWSWGEKQRSFICRIPDTVTSVTVKPKHDGTIVAFLASAPPPETPMLGSHPDFSTVYPTRIRLDIGGDTEYAIQETMNYLFVLVKNSSGNFVGPEITFTATSTTLQAVDTEVADETNVVDRRNEIYAMLSAFGKCELGKGVFYSYKNLCIPDGAMLCGSGKDTILKLLASVESGSAIKMGPYATVRDMVIKGADADQNGNETEGSRNGVEWTGETQVYGTVDNCRIINFSGSGIYLHDTTQLTYRGLSIISCNIRGNYVGIDIRKDSEFNKIVNSIMTGNNIGYRNRGGNNNIANCGLDANKTGILVDNAAGTNNGHGFISNCSIDHSNSNTGYGLIIKGTGRMLVSNCNMYFSKLRLENTDGNVISGCGFGRAAGWEIEGGECSLFVGCMVRGWDAENSPVTITDNTAVKIVNCFDRTGTPYA